MARLLVRRCRRECWEVKRIRSAGRLNVRAALLCAHKLCCLPAPSSSAILAASMEPSQPPAPVMRIVSDIVCVERSRKDSIGEVQDSKDETKGESEAWLEEWKAWTEDGDPTLSPGANEESSKVESIESIEYVGGSCVSKGGIATCEVLTYLTREDFLACIRASTLQECNSSGGMWGQRGQDPSVPAPWQRRAARLYDTSGGVAWRGVPSRALPHPTSQKSRDPTGPRTTGTPVRHGCPTGSIAACRLHHRICVGGASRVLGERLIPLRIAHPSHTHAGSHLAANPLRDNPPSTRHPTRAKSCRKGTGTLLLLLFINRTGNGVRTRRKKPANLQGLKYLARSSNTAPFSSSLTMTSPTPSHLVDDKNKMDGTLHQTSSVVGEEEPFTFTAEEEARLVRKIDIRMLPAVWTMYLMSYLDRSNIGNAYTAGMGSELKMTSNDYSVVLLVFFITVST